MKLTKEQQERIINLLQSKNRFMNCPMCKGGMTVLDEVFTIPAFDISNGNLNLSSSTFTPCIALMCKDCGNMTFFNLKILGIDYK